MNSLEIILLVVAALALIAFGYVALHPWHDFLILVKDKAVSFQGQFPPESRAAATQFFSSDLALPGRYRVLGRWKPNRILELRFAGELPKFHHQRIRNFLAMTLRSGR